MSLFALCLTCRANKLCSPLRMKLLSQAGIGAILACVSMALAAGPAPWYQWRSKVDGKLACAQTSLGHGWEKASGPYRDSHCKKLSNQKYM